MTSLPDALRDAVMGGVNVAHMSLRGVMLALRGIAGTVTAAARLAGIDRRTWQRWETGAIRTPGQAKQDQMRKALRQARANERRPNLIRGGGRLVIIGEICVSNDCRKKRKLDLSADFTRNTRSEIVDAVAAGDDDAAAERFELALETDYDAPGMYVLDVDSLEWR